MSVIYSVEAVASIKETKEEREMRIREEMNSIIYKFKSSSQITYNFPSTLNSFERMIVHQVSTIYLIIFL